MTYIYLRIVFENIHFIPRLGDFLAEWYSPLPVYHVYVICIYPNEEGGIKISTCVTYGTQGFDTRI